ncbi:hypothetical protein STM474_0818 [Salmonella enterica subsp. enterica serovar Typhimurium str. ST4/74]|uniref:Uncharacterized protein n=1 Tax=Salmonella typhimurium (strain 4/74) TaxID=909946 RepID=E8XBQ6_SALT4|nr:hypothetical protein STM474_0818 [Salmonella enterica subsp. enterica serovar Typhimurium str. ST4/74]
MRRNIIAIIAHTVKNVAMRKFISIAQIVADKFHALSF